jgi:hypothetical protein
MAILDVADVLPRRNDVKYWSGELVPADPKKDNFPPSPITINDVSMEVTGLMINLTIESGQFAGDHELLCLPIKHDLHHTQVVWDGVADTGANMIFGYKGSIGNPDRFGFDFRPFEMDGHQVRLNLRYDP